MCEYVYFTVFTVLGLEDTMFLDEYLPIRKQVPMYSSFNIKNFRGFEDFTLNNIQRINLIAGKNNVGKTSLLEALFIHAGTYNPELGLRVNAFRGLDRFQVRFSSSSPTGPWDLLFKEFDTTKEIELTGYFENQGWHKTILRVIRQAEELSNIIHTFSQEENDFNGGSFSPETTQLFGLDYIPSSGEKISSYVIVDREGIHTRAVPPAAFEIIFLPSRLRIPAREDADRYGQLVRHKEEEIIRDVLQVIEPNLEKLVIIPSGETSTIYADITGHTQLVPLPVLGDGISRLASLALAISNAKGGVVLIDEIENGLHHSVLEDVWKVVDLTSRRFNTQIFATTHSLEAIRAAHQAFSNSDPYNFRLHRLDRILGRIEVSTFDEETLDAAIDMDLEVR
jgi:AAA15 family ATPase/GTPase